VALTLGVGSALLYGPLTAGLRMNMALVVLGGNSRYYLADVGAHGRLGMAKLTGVVEIGAHQFVDVTTFQGPTGQGSKFLPSVGARASIDIASGMGPAIGWWAELHYDVGQATLDPYVLGGALFASGLQIGFDIQGSSR
jgi:hypothetical protein